MILLEIGYDNRYNPLKYIPDPSLQIYFTLVLFVMWSVYFGFVASYYMGWLGYSIAASSCSSYFTCSIYKRSILRCRA